MSSFKSHATMLWVLLVLAVSVGAFIYLAVNDEPAAKTIIEPLQFQDERDIAESISKTLPLVELQNKFFWIGVEPEKNEHVDVARALTEQLKTQNTIQKIIVDQELSLKADTLKQLGATDIISVKENLYSLGEKLQELEKNNISYIFISASIYTNSLLKKNPFHVLTEKFNLKPVTFSFAYLPTTGDDEKNMLFGCRTEDQTGTSEWGCVVVSRARFARRKFASGGSKNWYGLMDLSNKKSYMLLLKKNE